MIYIYYIITDKLSKINLSGAFEFTRSHHNKCQFQENISLLFCKLINFVVFSL